MERLTVNLEHCYGIKKMEAEFDFASRGDVFTIYAPNGVMKTSFANAFRDVSLGSDSRDRIWPERVTTRSIVDENGSELISETVFVVEPYREDYHSDRMSKLLVNDGLCRKYDAIRKGIDEKAAALVKEIQPFTGLRSGVTEELSRAFTHDPNDFFRALGRVKEEVAADGESHLAGVRYADIFNPKIESLITGPEFSKRIQDYITQFNELLSTSTFFKTGVFTHNNAAVVAKNLSSNGFFEAGHSVKITVTGESKEVATADELDSAIQSEKDRILTDKKLSAAWEAIDKQLNKNVDLRKLRSCLVENQFVIPELANLDRLRQKLWVAYLTQAKEQFDEVTKAYAGGQSELAEIVEEAKNQRTRWAEVIEIFNDRFSVPFHVGMVNQEDVILRQDAPNVSFEFIDDDEGVVDKAIDESVLKEVLSNGEKRALYILNILFEIEARRAEQHPTLFIVDDIADSFDYKNKYAIIEYLKEVSGDQKFQMIILTHNFDFHRTVSSRLQLERSHRLVAVRTNDRVLLEEEKYQWSPFAHWRKNLDKWPMLIASIPLVRNLAEFGGDDDAAERLTSLLHIKSDTTRFTVGHLQTEIQGILRDQGTLTLSNPERPVKDVIYEVAEELSASNSESAVLEEKIVLSIAIRLKAEEHMIIVIDDDEFVQGIQKNQTAELVDRFKKDHGDRTDSIVVLEQVTLMTPENIHLNSFMFEPILDLSPQHLRTLYRKARDLAPAN